MIYCIWYPSGGFGHFINAIVSLYGKNFVKAEHGELKFSATGDSHQYALAAPAYRHDPDNYSFDFDQNKNYTVLIDNGINSQTDRFKSFFPQAITIKICYSDYSWPVVARTMIDKAMATNIQSALAINEWAVDEPWARREKYFLFLRDHHLKNAWRPENENFINVEHLFDYKECYNRINNFIELEPFEDIWQQWRVANSKYIDPVDTANLVIQYIKDKQTFDLRQVTDLWSQAVIYYYFWLCFGIEVPHYDFANWIDSTDQLSALL